MRLPAKTQAALGALVVVGASIAPIHTASQALASDLSCAVINLTSGAGPTSNLQRVIDRAGSGDRIRVRGVCQGHVTVKKDLVIVGKSTRAWPRPTLDPTVTGCDAHCYVVKVSGGADTTLVLRDLTVTGGRRPHGGGGIYLKGADLTLRGATRVTANSALWFGGGIYLSEDFDTGRVLLTGHSVVSGNGARDGGGGIFGRLVVLRGHSSVTSNSTKHSAGGIRGSVSMHDHSSVTSNTSRSSGGILGDVTMHDYSRVCDNTVQYGSAGGIGGTVTMWEWATVCDNTSSGRDVRTNNGGGIVGTLTMHGSSSVSGNYAHDNGGGIVCSAGSTVTLNNNATIAGNSADVDGGGIFNQCDSIVLNDQSAVSGNTPNDISPL